MKHRPGSRYPVIFTIAAALTLVVLAGWAFRGGDPAIALRGWRRLNGNGTTPAPLSPGDPANQPVNLVGARVGYSSRHGVSPSLRSLAQTAPNPSPRWNEPENPPIHTGSHTDQPDPVAQRSFGNLNAMPSPILNFPGIDFQGGAPPDTNGDVGTRNYVQMVNSAIQVWDKQGNPLLSSPVDINLLWSNLGSECYTHNDGDPVVLWDPIANRWLLSQFTTDPPYHECIAISVTDDAMGEFYIYAYQLSQNDFPDYPHLGVWPDGYYMSENMFVGGQVYGGPQAYVFDRNAMLNGDQGVFQTFPMLGSQHAPFLPSDLDGPTLPPAGAPNYFAEYGDPMLMYKFHVDWANPSNSTFTQYASVDVAGFSELCPDGACVSQKNTSQKLDSLGDRLMHRLAYRNFGDHESLVVNHAADVGGGVGGVRWYEIRNPGGTPSIYQQSTYSPDTHTRWMGSVAMDHVGNLAVGYSVSSSSLFPSIRYAGRLVSDPPGQLSQGETSLLEGSGSQVGVYRWGDYSAMAVDPVDDCTFWYTQEYNPSFNWYWKTRIGSFKFPSCTNTNPTPTPTRTRPPVTLTPWLYLPAVLRNAAAPVGTPTPSRTPVNATATRTPTRTHTPANATATQTPTRTNTPLSPTATHTPTLTNTPLNPTATHTPTPTATTPAGWTTIFEETFEGTFPGPWQVLDNDGTNHGEYYWGARTCRAYAGSNSGWAVGAGAGGSGKDCQTNYPNNADSWMIYGPFSLADASAANLNFKLWLNTESGSDKLYWYASTDGTYFNGYWTSGGSSAWTDMAQDLADPNMGDLLGQPQVWIAFRFTSDVLVTRPEGAYVDNVLIEKQTGRLKQDRPTSVMTLDHHPAQATLSQK